MGTTKDQRLKLLFAIVEVNLFVSSVLFTTEQLFLRDVKKKKGNKSWNKKVMTCFAKKGGDGGDKKGSVGGDKKGSDGGDKAKKDKRPTLDASNYFRGVAGRWILCSDGQIN